MGLTPIVEPGENSDVEPAPPRNLQQRKQDTLARLNQDVDAWVASQEENELAGRDLMRAGRWLV
ncbi:hypothetical protein ACGFIW_04170 [Micromonospora sp. NPDC048935]|uniref:hypothetical protein n=1 Tax=Micromonospora sp. NPDC048935 TaxID=3364262 RepID=UPI00371BCEF2